MLTPVLRHFYLLCICFIALAGVPLVPRRIDRWFPIPIPGLSWHEVLESIFMYILSLVIFSLYYRMITYKKTSIPSVLYFIPILLSLMISIEGNGIHWSCNAIHSTFNPGNEKSAIKYTRQKTLYSLTYFLDEYWGHHLLIGGNCLSFVIIVCAEYLCGNDLYTKKYKLHNHNEMMWIDILLFYVLSFGMAIVLFAAGIEGQVAKTIILPFSFIMVIQRIFMKPVTNNTFYTIQNFLCSVSLVATILTLLWGWYFEWTFPEFRVLGLGPFSTWFGKFLSIIKLYTP